VTGINSIHALEFKSQNQKFEIRGGDEMRTPIKPYWLVVTLITVASVLLSACAAPATPAPTPVPPTAVPPTAVPPTAAPTNPPAAMATAAPPTVAPTATAIPKPTAAPPVVTSKELNIYAWSEYIPQELLDAFANEYKIKVNYDTYASNEELMAKLQAGKTNYDVIIPSDYTVSILVGQKMLEPMDLDHLPNFVNVDDQFKNPSYDPGNQYSVPYQWGTVGIAVNTAKVTKPITKFADLWDPSFKNELVVLDDEREIIGMALLVLGYDKNSTDPAQLDAAKKKLIELKPNIKLYDSDSPKTALLSGEAVAGVVWNGEASLAHQENDKIAYILPDEGAGLWYDNMAIPKGAPHKDAATAFINFVLRPDMSILITKGFPYSSVNKAALELLKTQEPDTYKSYMDYPATNPPADAVKKGQVVKDVGDATTLWDKVWTEVKGSQ
jgi:spermidine/putrescine-binding protein